MIRTLKFNLSDDEYDIFTDSLIHEVLFLRRSIADKEVDKNSANFKLLSTYSKILKQLGCGEEK